MKILAETASRGSSSGSPPSIAMKILMTFLFLLATRVAATGREQHLLVAAYRARGGGLDLPQSDTEDGGTVGIRDTATTAPTTSTRSPDVSAAGRTQGFAARPFSFAAQASVTVAYTVRVGLLTDSTATPSACSASAQLATCNLRSALALCMALIKAQACPTAAANALALGCTVWLPSKSVSAVQGATYGAVVNASAALGTGWAATCQYTTVTLAVTSDSRSTAVVGDSSRAALLVMSNLPFFSLAMTNVTVSNFGNSQFSGAAVVTSAVLSATFRGCTFKGNAGLYGAVYVNAIVASAVLTDCLFDQNVAGLNGGALTVESCDGVTLRRCRFVRNSAVNSGNAVLYVHNSALNSGSALLVLNSLNTAIVQSQFFSNVVYGNSGRGGASYIQGSSNVSLQSVSFSGNKVVGDGGLGGALEVDVSSGVSLTDVVFTNSSVVGSAGAGGAIGMISCSKISLTRVTFISSVLVGRMASGGAVYLQASSDIAFDRVTFTNSTISGRRGNGGALVVSYSTTVVLRRSHFSHNALLGDAGHGGALWVNESSYIALADVAFVNNKAGSTGQGGAIFLATGVEVVSIGGLLPVAQSCAGCNTVPAGTTFQYDTVATASDDTAMGFYVVFPAAIPFGVIAAEPVGAIVGDYVYGCYDHKKDGNCPAADTAPGVNGVAPYFYKGPNVPIHIVRSNTKGNPNIAFDLFPRAAQTGCSFVGNAAGDVGGAIYADGEATNIFIIDSVFTRNIAANGGGAVYLYYFNNGVYFYSSTFTNNTAMYGGAVALSIANVGVHFTDCVFRGNTAQLGGAVYTGFINGVSGLTTTVAIVFVNTTLVSNAATMDGGAVYVSTYNKLSVVSSQFQRNVANYRGGGLFADVDTNSVQVSVTTFTGNRAVLSGGAIGSSGNNNITFLTSTSFVSNRVDGSGGGIAMHGGRLNLGAGAITFRGNSAVRTGSAMYIDSSSTTSVALANSTAPVLFTRNKCIAHGGTWYWIADSDISNARFDPVKLPYAQRLVFAPDNVAPVSPTIATEAWNISLTNRTTGASSYMYSSNATVTDYVTSRLVPTPSFSLLDYYNVVNVTDSSSYVTASVWAENGPPRCGENVGYLSGVSNITVTKGVATFDRLSAYCFPGSNMTVLFTAQLSGFNKTYDMFFTIGISFRPCRDGEVLVKNQCLMCPDGKYSFKYSPTATCTPCPPNTAGCAGGAITAAPGYWRASKTSTVMLPCPYPKGCMGGAGVTNATTTATTAAAAAAAHRRRLTDVEAAAAAATTTTTTRPSTAPSGAAAGTMLSDAAAGCAAGYTGPLCAVCADAYYFDTGTSECKTCSGQGAGQLAILITVPMITLLVLAYVMLFSSLASDTFFGEFMTDPKTMAMLQGNVRKGKFEASKFVALAKSATKKRAKGGDAVAGGEEKDGDSKIVPGLAFMQEAAEKSQKLSAAAKGAPSLRTQLTKMTAQRSTEEGVAESKEGARADAGDSKGVDGGDRRTPAPTVTPEGTNKTPFTFSTTAEATGKPPFTFKSQLKKMMERKSAREGAGGGHPALAPGDWGGRGGGGSAGGGGGGGGGEEKSGGAGRSPPGMPGATFMKEVAGKRVQIAAAATTAFAVSTKLKQALGKREGEGKSDEEEEEEDEDEEKEKERDVEGGEGSKRGEEEDDGAASALAKNVARAEKLLKAAKYMKMAQKYMQELKILTTVFQIVTSFRFSLNIVLPPSAGQLFKAVSFVNFSALSAGSPQCFMTFDYVDKLLLVTCSPLIVVAVAMLLLLVHSAYYKYVAKLDHRELVPRYLRLIIIISYLVLPSVTTTIAGAFTTVNVDPEGLVPGTPRYLRNDYSIAQNSTRYKFGFAWATFMIFVYPVGVPALYYYLLYVAHDDIVHTKPNVVDLSVELPDDAFERQKAIQDVQAKLTSQVAPTSSAWLRPRSGPRELGDLQFLRHRSSIITMQQDAAKHSFSAIVAQQLGFLHGAYRRQYYYWEVIETMRRLLLTAVVSVVGTGSSLQIVFGIFIALLFMKLYAFYQPYADDRHDELQEIAQYQVFFTLFIALLIRTNAFDGAYNVALDAAMVVANSITPAYTFYIHFEMPAWLGPLLATAGLWRVAARVTARFHGDDAQTTRPFTAANEHWHTNNEGPENEDLAAAGVNTIGSSDVIPPASHRRDSISYYTTHRRETFSY